MGCDKPPGLPYVCVAVRAVVSAGFVLRDSPCRNGTTLRIALDVLESSIKD